MTLLLGFPGDDSFGRAFALPHVQECYLGAGRRPSVSDERQFFAVVARWERTNGGPAPGALGVPDPD
jgi:hypothetical protein